MVAHKCIRWEELSEIKTKQFYTDNFQKKMEEFMEKTNKKLESVATKQDIKDIKDMFEKLDTKFASKLSEKIVYWMVAIIVIAVLSALLTFVIKQWI